jgi:hypothetical protein
MKSARVSLMIGKLLNSGLLRTSTLETGTSSKKSSILAESLEEILSINSESTEAKMIDNIHLRLYLI